MTLKLNKEETMSPITSDAPTSAGLAGPPTPVPDFIVTVRQEGNGKGYTVELPYGPYYFFEKMKDCMEFVERVLSRYL